MPEANTTDEQERPSPCSVSFKRAFGTASGIVLALLMIACTMSNTAYQTQKGLKRLGFKDQQRSARAENWVLPANARVFMAYPQVGTHLRGELPRLQYGLSVQMERQLAQTFSSVAAAPVDAGPETAHLAAMAGGFTVLLVPRIDVYEANISSLNEWSREGGTSSREPPEYGSDRLQLVVTVYDVQSGRMLDSVVVRGKTGFWAFSRRDPAQLAEGAVAALTRRLSAGPVYTRLD